MGLTRFWAREKFSKKAPSCGLPTILLMGMKLLSRKTSSCGERRQGYFEQFLGALPILKAIDDA